MDKSLTCAFLYHVRRNNDRKARNQAKPLAKHVFPLCCLELVTHWPYHLKLHP